MPIDLNDRKTWPRLYSVWTHFLNGNRYQVILFTNVEPERQDKYPTTIVYRNTSSDNVYSRRLDDWDRSMTAVQPVLQDGFVNDIVKTLNRGGEVVIDKDGVHHKPPKEHPGD